MPKRKTKLKKVFILNKREGETPLAALSRLRAKNKKYGGIKMTYAGRLDPMASGLLIVLLGEETKNKERYLALDKEYEFEILFGFVTDTYDILGKIEHSHILKNIGMLELNRNIKKMIKNFTGEFVQNYPMYSSKTVKGKPLFQYARDGKEVEAPSKRINVKFFKLIKLRKINSSVLLNNIEKRIKKVRGDFRQEEILKIWKKKLKGRDESLFIGSFKIRCGSGTYVRGIAHSLGEKMGVPALAYSIKRTKVGKFAKIS